MSTDTYSGTVLTIHTGDETHVRMAGQVVRSTAIGAFGDAVILGFTSPNKYGDVWAKLDRPYIYASSIGTTCPNGLLGHETYAVRLDDLLAMTLVDAKGGYVSAAAFPGVADRPYDDEKIEVKVDERGRAVSVR